MTHAQLPASIIPYNSQIAAASPLARYLAGHLQATHVLAYDQVPSAMEGALAMATLYPFDTDERIDITNHQGTTRSWSLLEAVLSLTNPHRAAAERRQWPLDPTQFGPHLLADSTRPGHELGVDNEWVAASLAAAGCNPWTDSPEVAPSQLPPAIEMALTCGFGGLLERFLDCPGAWSAQQIADSSIARINLSPLPVWQSITFGSGNTSCLSVLLERGARLTDAHQAVGVLNNASAGAVAALAAFDLIELSAAASKKITVAWKERHARRDLSAQQVEDMSVAIWGAASETLSSTALNIGAWLSLEWGKTPTGSSSSAYDFMGDTGAEQLLGRAQTKTGSMAGQWSVLAAAVVSRIRQSTEHGALGWSTGPMLYREYNKAGNGWCYADCSQPPYRGSLAEAIGFEWRPGISIDGPIALSLFGQRWNSRLSMGPSTHDLQEPEVQKDILAFGNAAGIPDVVAWARTHAPSAAAFTIQSLRSPMVNATRCFLHTWETALVRQPDLAEALTEEQRADLLLALTARFQLTSSWTSSDSALSARPKDAFNRIARTLFPTLSHKSLFEDSSLTGIQLRVALIWGLTSAPGDTPMSKRSLEIIERRLLDFAPDDFTVVEAWMKGHHSDPQTQKALQAQAQTWRLEYRTAAAPSQSTTPRGPRL